jgi:hypothetical protein
VWVSSTHLLAAAETTEIGKAHKMRELYYGPYKIIRWRGPATLELDIPANVWPIKAKSAIFPISRVKPYRETEDIRQLKKMGLVKIPDKAEVIQDHHYEVSRILGHKNTAGKAAAKYLVRWVGFDSEDMQWITEEEIKRYAPRILAKYVAWAKKHQRMTNNVPEFAHIDELETDGAEPATDGGSSSN